MYILKCMLRYNVFVSSFSHLQRAWQLRLGVSQKVPKSKRSESVKRSPSIQNKLVKNSPLKRPQFITGKNNRNLFIFFYIIMCLLKKMLFGINGNCFTERDS